jgi:subfamily B ATP-binding cassette protein MsbA
MDLTLTEKVPITEKTRQAGMRLMIHVWRYRRPVIIGLVLTALAMTLNSSAALVLKYIIDSALIGKNMNMLLLGCAALVGTMFFKGICGYSRTMLLSWAGLRVVEDLRNDALDRIQAMSLGYFEKQRSGELMSRIMNDTSMIQMFVISTIAEGVMVVFGVLSSLAVAVFLSAKLTILAVVLSPFIIVAIASAGKKMKRLSHTAMESLADLQALLYEIISAMNVVKAFSMEGHERERFAKENRWNMRMNIKLTRVRALYTPLVELIGGAALALLFWVGGRDVIHATPDFITGKVLTTGDIVSLFVALQLLFTQFNRVNQIYMSVQNAFASADRTYTIIDMEPDVKDKPGAVEIPDVQGNIEFRSVGFEYNPGEPVLQDVIVTVKPGMVVALVGSSGAGKSTFIKLLPRFYDVTSGAILIEGVDIRDAAIKSYRRHIGIVPQDTILFRGTIRDNIAYGRPGATEEQILEASRMAYAHNFIKDMPDGYDTFVGEHGATLSGGQRQRVAIARAILKAPRILILDEATSNVDSVSEKYIQEALDNLMQTRTTFVVAHRLSTIKNADLILVMDKGRIVERGRHDELYAGNGVYRNLYETTLSAERAHARPPNDQIATDGANE